MSKPLFEFVEIAAGAKFPYPDGTYLWSYTPELHCAKPRHFIQDGIYDPGVLVLRPAEFPDAGREEPLFMEQEWNARKINFINGAVMEVGSTHREEARKMMIEYFPNPKDFIKSVPDAPDTNVGDIPEAQREAELIKLQTENPNGLHQRYHVEKITAVLNNGIRVTKPVDLGAEYFVMRLDSGGSDPKHIEACRKAVNNYADNIEPHLPELAADLRRRYPVTPADPGSQVEAVDPVKLLEWLAMMNEPCHADNNFTHRIIISDGEFYWDQDVDGDQPIDPADLIALYKQSLAQ